MFAFGFVGQLVLPLDLLSAALVRTLDLAQGVFDVARGAFSIDCPEHIPALLQVDKVDKSSRALS